MLQDALGAPIVQDLRVILHASMEAVERPDPARLEQLLAHHPRLVQEHGLSLWRQAVDRSEVKPEILDVLWRQSPQGEDWIAPVLLETRDKFKADVRGTLTWWMGAPSIALDTKHRAMENGLACVMAHLTQGPDQPPPRLFGISQPSLSKHKDIDPQDLDYLGVVSDVDPGVFARTSKNTGIPDAAKLATSILSVASQDLTFGWSPRRLAQALLHISRLPSLSSLVWSSSTSSGMSLEDTCYLSWLHRHPRHAAALIALQDDATECQGKVDKWCAHWMEGGRFGGSAIEKWFSASASSLNPFDPDVFGPAPSAWLQEQRKEMGQALSQVGDALSLCSAQEILAFCVEWHGRATDQDHLARSKQLTMSPVGRWMMSPPPDIQAFMLLKLQLPHLDRLATEADDNRLERLLETFVPARHFMPQVSFSRLLGWLSARPEWNMWRTEKNESLLDLWLSDSEPSSNVDVQSLFDDDQTFSQEALDLLTDLAPGWLMSPGQRGLSALECFPWSNEQRAEARRRILLQEASIKDASLPPPRF